MIEKMSDNQLLIDWDSKQFNKWLRHFRFTYARLFRYGYITITGTNVYKSKQTKHYHIILYYEGVTIPLIKSYYQALFLSDVKKELYYYLEGSNCLFEVKRKRGKQSVYEYDDKCTARLRKQILHINGFKQYKLRIVNI